jgi:hypothetical protein
MQASAGMWNRPVWHANAPLCRRLQLGQSCRCATHTAPAPAPAAAAVGAARTCEGHLVIDIFILKV